MSKEQEGEAEKTSRSPAGKSDKKALREYVDAFVTCVRTQIADALIDVIDQFDATGRLGFLVRETDRGEAVRGRFVDTISACSRQTGVHISLMPFPVNGNMLYEVVVRRLTETT